MLNTNNPNTYKVGTSYFRSKMQAALHSHQVKQPIEWLFAYDEVYRNYPWHIEPLETLDELYNQRAKQLREKYDYLMISYSGGSDSHNVLMSFVRQGIFVDELVIGHNEWFTKNLVSDSTSAENIDAEHAKNVIPKLKEIAEKIPNTKITLVDTSKHYLGFVDNINDDWIKEKNAWLNPFSEKFNFFAASDDFKKTVETKKNIGFILGTDKPKTFIDNKKFFVEFSDVSFTGSSAEQYNTMYDNFNTDYFYWSDQTARLICKQCHVIKNFVEANPSYIQHLDIKQKFNQQYFRTVIEKFLPNVIYTTWDNGFQVTKSKNVIYNEFDTLWWHALSKSQQTKWTEFLDYVKNDAKDNTLYVNGKLHNLKVFTKKYNFGDLK